MSKLRIIVGYQNTKDNSEDLALTPYLFLVKYNGGVLSVNGLGFCWLNFSAYIAIGFNIPKEIPFFINHSKAKKHE